MRLFIAAPISEEARSGARSVLEALRRSRADFKWVEPENLHLTLAFFSDVSAQALPALAKAMDQAAAGRRAFELAFGELGAFDSFERPRVLWIGVSRGAESLTDLAGALRAALDRAGLLPEQEKNRAFAAHLTLGRMRSPRRIAELKALLADSPPRAEFRSLVDRLALYESRLTSQGPVYREAAVVRLLR